jgi:ABC-type enterochelin transport system permease subunit
MKAKKGFNLREVCGEQIIVAEGKENIDFSNIISMNESSAYLWKKVQQMESFTADDLAQLLTEQYEVEYEVALNDATTLADQWVEAGIVEL